MVTVKLSTLTHAPTFFSKIGMYSSMAVLKKTM